MSLTDRISALTPEQRALFEKLREKQRQAARPPQPPPIPRVTGPTGEGDWPLSLDQERYWLMEQLYPQGAGLNLGSASRMRGSIALPVVVAALGELTRRHATWRTSFPLAGDAPVQRVAPTGWQRLAFIDLTSLPPERREAEALLLARVESAVPFDLQRGPLVRASLLRLGADDHICLLTIHHLIADGLSFPILWGELAVLCAAFATGRPAMLPEPPVHYADFAVWQRDWLRGEVLEGLVSWWRERLDGVPLVLDLPLDHPRPAVARMRGGQLVESLPAGLSERLRALSRGEGATLFMTGLAAFAALLHRHSGQEQLILGANNANRNRPEIETILGCFVTQVPFPIDLTGDPDFRELLARVRQSALGVYAHQDLPFGKLVEAIHPEREINRQPVVQALLQVLDGTPSGGGLAGLTFEPVQVFDGNARYDLMLTLFDRPEGILGELEYDADLFAEGTAARLFARLRHLLEAVAADPDLRLSAIPLLSAAERGQLRRDERTPALGPSPALPVHETIAEVARRQPGALAVVCGEERWSYGELGGRANALAWRLRRLGVGPEVRVAVCAERSAGLAAALLGVMAAGGAYLPIDPEDSPARIAFVLADSGAAVLVTDATVAARLPATALPRVLLDEPLSPASSPPVSGVLPENLAYVIYTSGSTGAPKGVGVSHAAFAGHVAIWARVHGVGPADRFLQFNSASFDPAVEQVATVLTSGAALMMRGPEMWEGEELTARVAALELTVVDLPTSVWSRWVAGPLAAADVPPSVRRVLIGGEELRAGHAREWHRKGLSHLPLLNGYGPTEAVVSATQHEVGPRDGESGRLSIGRPLPGRVARVLGRWGEERPVGAPGELCLGGPLARGYLGRPALTAERFVPDPSADEPGARLYRSGDLVRRRPDGGLEFLGRVDDQVKIRGFRVEPGEVAAALLGHPQVREAVVVARSDRSDGSDRSVGSPTDRRLVAYLVPAGPPPTDADLRAFLRGRLPEAMVPAAFVPLDALPLTTHGKVDRRALPPPPEAAELAGSAPPRDAREERLAAVWRQVLGLARLGIHDNFFQLGGDSILAIQVVARARREGLALTTRQIFEHQTVAALAAVAGSAGPETGEEQGQVAGEAPLTPVQRRFFAEERRRPWHYNQAVVLVPRRRLAAAALAAALDRLIGHHDALRLRFVGGRQTHAPVAPVPLLEADLRAAPAALAAAMEELQSGLDLEQGPLFTAALFRMTGGDRLLLTAHHLVVDGVSWRVLLEDLAAILEGLPLPPKTTSWKRWAELLAGHSRSTEIEAELPYWLGQPAVPPLPRDLPGEGGAVATVAVELGAETTRALLQEVPEVYRTRVDDLLLAALARAFAAWTGEGALRVELEGHGREEIFPGVDLSRTVGWFTTTFPVTLALPPGGGPREAIRAVKETLRAVPGRGLGYGLLYDRLALPAPEVSFNYLGRLDAAAGEADLLAFAPETVRNALGEAPADRPSFAIDALVVDGRLRVSWSYDSGSHLPATAERLASGFLAEIEGLVACCLSPGAGGFTPSDFPLAALSQEDLDRLLGSDRSERSVEDLYPLAPMQEGLLFHSLYAGAGADLYFEQLTAELEGDLDETAFAAAWQRVVERHTALRTGFLSHGVERPLQLVRRAAEIPWTSEDWRGLAPAEVEARWRDLLAADRARGFDLSRPPLLRLALARTGEETRRLVWSSHHILLDGWCFPLLLNEVFTLYGSAAAALPPARPYRDYVAWLRGRDEEEALRCWQRRLEGFTAPTPVPFDLPGALGRAQGGRPEDYFERETALPAPLLEGLAQRLRVTLNTVVQGAWALLLSRYAQERDVVFGAVVSGRPPELPGVESMVGLFINTVPVRVEVPEDEPASAWLPRLQADQLELRQHEWTPLAEIQKLVDLPPGEPLFASLLVFENYPFDTVAAGGVGGPRITRATLDERTNYPLTLTVVARGEMSLRLTADRRFEPATVRRLLAHLEGLLRGLAADPEAPLASRPLLAATERHQLTAEWSGAADVQPSRATIPALFAAQAARTPDAVAVVCGEEELTYADLDRRARQVAGRLLRRGVAPETRVAVAAERSLDLIPTLLGILQAGCAYLPVDPALPEERRRFLLEDAGAISLDQAEVEEVLELPAVSPDQLAYVIYTSGSTGVPKGVEVTHGNVARLVTGADDYAPLGPGETLLQVVNVAFDVSTFEIWVPLLNGGRVAVFPGRPEPDELARAIVRHGVSTLWLTTGLFHQMVEERLEALRPLRRLLAGGDALAPAPVRRALAGLPGLTLIDGYGPTENTAFTTRHVMTAADLADERLAGTVPIGRPLRGTTVHVLDESLRPVPVGVWGELCTGGEGVARGYLARPALTAERFVPDPWRDGGRLYRTGDVVRWRPDGLLEFLGRRDGQVKIRGFRVELGEIEAALAAVPGVREAVVLARSDRSDGADRSVGSLVAYVTGDATTGELRQALRERLPDYMIPAAFVFLDRLPLTPNGKVDRRALPSPDPAAGRAREHVAPANSVEEALAAACAEVLELERVGMRDSFFALGGHSLLATRLVIRLRDRYGLDVPLQTVFDAADLRDLADRIIGQTLEEEAGGLSPEELEALLAGEEEEAV